MLSIVMLLALTAAGADERACVGHLSGQSAEIEMLEAEEAEEAEAIIYAAAEIDFADRFEELGLAGSTLGREEALAAAGARATVAGIEGPVRRGVTTGGEGVPIDASARNR